MHRGAWWATVHGVAESDGTEHTFIIQIILGTLKTTSTSTVISRHLKNLPSEKKKKKKAAQGGNGDLENPGVFCSA